MADLFWFQPPQEAGRYERDSIGVEKYFGLYEKHEFDYFPASAFQTPVFQLLRLAPQQTVNFILSFINKSVGCYAKSKLNNEVEEVEVFVEGTKPVKQYISNRLWNMYRGTQVSTSLLESMHMALEKWLLENAKSMSKENLESWCLYLLRNSISASITAVVTSVVLAQPSKLFNIAKILFKTKDFFLYDTSRMVLDQTTKSHYSIGYGLNYQYIIYQDERIKTCDEAHRKDSLEYLALKYQLFRSEEESEEEVVERQNNIWEIFDKYYQELPDRSLETEHDKTWRLYLARMDRRKMNPEVQKKDGQVVIEFNPEIDPELKKYSEDSIKKSSASMKYSTLKLWAEYRFRREENKCQQYQNYENNSQLVIAETKEIIEGLDKNTEDNFFLFNHSIPAYVCSVLIRDFFDKLNSEEKEFCKEVIIEYASTPIKAKDYHYQISDGTEPSITILPHLIKHFAKEKKEVKLLLILIVINPRREISTFAIGSILHSLWEISFDDAHAIFLGYLLLKPKHNDLIEEIRKENYQKNVYNVSEAQVHERFIKEYGSELEGIVSNRITYDELEDIKKIGLRTLITAFELLPLKIENEDHKKFLNVVLPIFSEKLFVDDDMVDYILRHSFYEKYAYFILNSTKNEIQTYLKPFIDNFKNSREAGEFIREVINAEDRLNKYEEFWTVWNAFYHRIIELCKKPSSPYYAKEILQSYLLSRTYWKEDAKEWHTLKDREKLFFKKVTEDIGHHPSVLYSISKILNGIGSNFINDGVLWISSILEKNQHLLEEELDTDTIYYMENMIRRYILTSRKKIKTSLQIKNQVIIILSFLIERGSITGYLLREDIL